MAGYRRLNDGRFRTAFERRHRVLVAEGALAMSRLLVSPHLPLSMLLAGSRAAAAADLMARFEGRGAAVFTADQEVLDAVAGYPVHRGLLALGRRSEPLPAPGVLAAGGLVLAVEGVNDGENMGSLMRAAAAFGAAAVLDPTSCDHLSRRAVRVSVGHSLTTAVGRSAPGRWPADLADAVSAGAFAVALTPDPSAPALSELLAAASPRGTLVFAVGAEGPGLAAGTFSACGRVGRIPIAAGVDSLNVAAAAAVALYEGRRLLGG